jgi:hypothetical protein
MRRLPGWPRSHWFSVSRRRRRGWLRDQQLQAELLSIAGTFQLSDALPAGVIQEPVHIRLDNEQLRIDRIK